MAAKVTGWEAAVDRRMDWLLGHGGLLLLGTLGWIADHVPGAGRQARRPAATATAWTVAPARPGKPRHRPLAAGSRSR